ncbi:hypothetical protein MGG_13617 [Pyricularia oryzae 70-15]|uniref:Piwi domain-containing protein n=1 Tax=Pyricularia oryzae (strain 70-15 / ATCC MYA-4617 / FGSC 8958) TaxID=242507 RepID=G4N9E4_PYRO7|nr:uncharacterized protein MGG_13617 [Pyricularia oryzae 70-15]EHA51185.1 hypothetical protein MGG_13617 [Pyricularia oryzae 70-15]KAI7917612.1 hypothetical protein M9X92_007356 [Pyricularia oryzae]
MNRNAEDRLYSGTLRPVDDGVKDLENKISVKIKAAKTPEKKQAVMPPRPAYGSKGIPVTLWTNYVEMTFGKGKDLVLYKYSIAISPLESGRKQQRIIQLFLEKWKQDLATFGQIYSDFKSFLISTTKLDIDELDVIKNSSLDFIKDGHTEAPKNPNTYRATVEAQGELSVQGFLKYLSEEKAIPTFANKLDMIQALNIFLNHYNKTNKSVVAVGANRTFNLNPQRPPPGGQQQNRDRGARASADVMDLGGGLEAFRGFFSSIRPATGRLLININVTSAAFYKQGTLANLINSFGKHSLFSLDKFLKRLRVEPTHLESKASRQGAGSSKSSRKRYRTIFGLAREGDGASMPPNERPKISKFGAGPAHVQFWLAREGQKGRYITVSQYFQQAYGITLDSSFPVINVGNRDKPTYMPVDICEVYPGQVAREKLTPAQMEEMVEFAAQRPWFNAEQITRSGLLLTGASNSVNNCLTENNITVGKELITVPGRVLPQPKPQYRFGSEVSMGAGGWNMRNCKFNEVVGGGTSRPWGCLTLDGRYPANSQHLVAQLEAFRLHLSKAGINLDQCKIRSCTVGRSTTQDFSVLDETLGMLKPTKTKDGIRRPFDFVLIILPDKDVSRYNMIKYLGDVCYGVPTVCVASRTFFPARGADQMFGNLGLKINLKLGGVNHKIEDSLLGIVAQGKTMIVGIDVTHPPAGATATPSIAAMVASIDSNLAQWPGEIGIQSQARKEQVDALTSMLQSRLRIWKAKNKDALPENILVYRDGVSKGQYAMVQGMEIPLLEKACELEYRGRKMPNMTVVVVGKRHHTRFYPTSTGRTNMVKNNVAPGTVVDRGITEAHTWDFFLQSHEALKGTGRPAHYIVVMDQIFRPGFERGEQLPIRSGPPQGGRGGGLKLPLGANRGGGNNKSGGGGRGGGASTGGAQLNEVDTLEMLTYSLCNVFGRATRSVSYATPAYFADILCERGRCWLAAFLEVRRPMDDAETASVLSAGEIRKIANPQAKKDAEKKLADVQQQGRKAAMDACRVHPALADTVFYL